MKKLLLTLFVFLFTSNVYADWCLYEESTGVIRAVSTNQFNPPASAIYSEASCPDGTNLVPAKKWNGSSVETATAQDVTDYNAAVLAGKKADRKQILIDKLAETNAELAIEKALALTLKDEINILRTWIRDFQAVVASSNNLTEIKSGVAGLSTLTDRTNQQAVDAITNKLGTGDVD